MEVTKGQVCERQAFLTQRRNASCTLTLQHIFYLPGLHVTYNVSKPEGQRVTSVTIGNSGGGIDSEKFYQVTAPAYLAGGGDGYTMFKENKKNVQVIGRDQKIFETYIRKNSPLHVVTDGRIKIIED
ncbi:apyrase-like [Ostrinia furnacalis]|uniref:apyrase-like n=1 Tax=Ostrinia furnacalis TaxID=93504 RepID=UPI00103B5E87|nr:apyrase-like [Ostrinia furnacalis]